MHRELRAAQTVHEDTLLCLLCSAPANSSGSAQGGASSADYSPGAAAGRPRRRGHPSRNAHRGWCGPATRRAACIAAASAIRCTACTLTRSS